MKINKALDVIATILLVISVPMILFGFVCLCNSMIIHGMIIIGSLLCIDTGIIYTKVKANRAELERAYKRRGAELFRAACHCEYCVFESSDGEVVMYDSGLTYEVNGKEQLGFIEYGRMADLCAIGDGLQIVVYSQMTNKHMILKSKNTETIDRIRDIFGMHGVAIAKQGVI